jgi:hypothetical protein
LLLRATGSLRVRLRTIIQGKPDNAGYIEVKSLEERQGQLVRFYAAFERLASLLNEASHYGPSTRHELEYAQVRQWMLTHYGPIRRHLAPYMDTLGAPSGYGHDDEFQTLFASPTLAELLRCDDGRLPARVRRAQEVLMSYGTHLNALAGASAPS